MVGNMRDPKVFCSAWSQSELKVKVPVWTKANTELALHTTYPAPAPPPPHIMRHHHHTSISTRWGCPKVINPYPNCSQLSELQQVFFSSIVETQAKHYSI